MLERARREGRVFAVLSADMDGLKHINDTYGHLFGDEAIRRMGQAVSLVCGKDTICAHFSGDEFMMAAVTDAAAEAERLPETLQRQLEQADRQDPWVCPVKASAGVFAAVPMAADSLSDFIRFADGRMYENKRARKGLRATE